MTKPVKRPKPRGIKRKPVNVNNRDVTGRYRGSVPLFRDAWLKAQREEREIVAVVLMQDNQQCKFRFDKLGNWEEAGAEVPLTPWDDL